MTRFVAVLAAMLLPAPALAQAPGAPAAAEPSAAAEPPALSLEHRMLLRCSAAFALVAHRQAAGDTAALAHPPLDERGREFFVQASARVIDETAMDRAAIAAALTREALDLTENGGVDAVMPACLSALEAAGL